MPELLIRNEKHRNKARLVELAPLGKRLSRDIKDDIYLAAAIAAEATYIVTYAKDLLALEKPFGIEIIRPPEFLRRIKANKLWGFISIASLLIILYGHAG